VEGETEEEGEQLGTGKGGGWRWGWRWGGRKVGGRSEAGMVVGKRRRLGRASGGDVGAGERVVYPGFAIFPWDFAQGLLD
jgi:hypothetical protein